MGGRDVGSELTLRFINWKYVQFCYIIQFDFFVDIWKELYNLIFRMNKKMKITTMFISKKPTRSNREIKRSIFKHWRNLTISMKISLKIFSSTYSHLARKKN